ncbi:hypothetical protein BX666DRAFT_1894567 [Dichotomocladium elegans]|nr:hypothetical protein BX666DRAFT_1894567 [Dichotomocladium elegans]
MGRNVNANLPEIKAPRGFPHTTTVKSIFHMLQALATVLTICVVAPVIATEVHFYGTSKPGPNYTLAVGLMSLAVPICLITFPWIYNRNGKFRRLGKFCLKPRTSLIFTAFYTGFWATAGIAMTVHANDSDNCILYSDKEDDFGDDYRSAWPIQCSCAKATAGLAWTTCILWLCSLLCTLIIIFKEKKLIQKNIREHEANKNAVLMQQQEQRDLDDELYAEEIGHHGSYRSSGYYEDDGEEGLGVIRPKSSDQARPFRDPIHFAATVHSQSPFDSPHDPSNNNHGSYEQHQQASQDLYSSLQQKYLLSRPYGTYSKHQQDYPIEHSPFDDRYAHETYPIGEELFSAPRTPPISSTSAPITMPDHSQYVVPHQSSSESERHS